MSSAICFNLDQSKILSSGNGLMVRKSSHAQAKGGLIHRGYYLFFSVKDRNLFHRVDTIGNIFTTDEATSENITDGVYEMK